MPLFTGLHFLLLAFCLGIIVFAAFWPLTDFERQRRSLWIPAAVLTFNEIAWTTYSALKLGVPVSGNLPLHICDLGQICLIVQWIRPNRFTERLLPFVGVPGALLALVLPSIDESGREMYFSIARYFIAHTAIVVGGLRVSLALGKIPGWRDVRWAFGVFVAAMVPITLLNLAMGMNYSYNLRRPEAAPFLDVLPPALYPILYYPAVLLFFAATAWALRGLARLRPGSRAAPT